MSGFLLIIAVGVPVSMAICILHAAIRRRFDLVVGGLPALVVTGLLGGLIALLS
jgi:hypothetical protein